MSLSLIFAVSAHAAAPMSKMDLSVEERQAIVRHHKGLNKLSIMSTQPTRKPARPYSEVEEAGYLFFAEAELFDSSNAKRLLAKNLPDGVTMIVYTDSDRKKEAIINRYKDVLDPSRIKVIKVRLDRSEGFWTRDGMPVPVWSDEQNLDLVDARYYYPWEPDQDINALFGGHLYKHSYYFEGGNFMVNDKGDCLTVDNDKSSSIPMDIFYNTYGCSRVIRFEHLKGIGHMDESVRFMRSNVVVTDTEAYATRLRAEGFEVHMLPRPQQPYETYVNALVVNDTVYVPVFNESGDEAALNVYRDMGFKVVPILSRTLSNDGLGSIHCITMTYPKVPFASLLKALGATEL